MGRKPDQYSVHIMLDGGHREEVRISGAKKVTELINHIFRGGENEDYITIPRGTDIENEYLIVRPGKVCGVMVETVFASSIGIPD